MAEAAEAEVSTLLPRVYTHLVHTQQGLNWVDVCTDLKALNWLQPNMPHVGPLCQNLLQIVDIWALATFNRESHFNLLQLNQVQIFLNEVFDRFSTVKAEMKEAHTVIRNKITSDFGFFKDCGAHLAQYTDADLMERVKHAVEVYEEMKKLLQGLFFHLKPSFQSENNRDIEDVLEEQFYRQMLEPLKGRLNGVEEMAPIYKQYDRSYSASFLSKPKGFITQIWTNQYTKETIFYGELNEAGLKHGYGRITYSNGDSYEGFWANDRYEGKGLYIWKDRGSYEGDFEAGKMHGVGKRVYQSGNVYNGQFADGKKQGTGEMAYKNGDHYEGEWADDCMHGTGTYTWSSGSSYTGGFSKDRRVGKGKLVLAADEVHEGEWVNGKFRPA